MNGESRSELVDFRSRVDSAGTQGASIEVGIDTLSVSWRAFLPAPIARKLSCNDGPLSIGALSFRRSFGNLISIDPEDERPAFGLRLGRGQGLDGPSHFWIEGRPRRGMNGLATIADALAWIDAAQECWHEAGIDLRSEYGVHVRRIDLAADVRFDLAADGARFLADLARVPIAARERKRVWKDHYSVAGEQVSGIDVCRIRGSKQHVVMRAYCKDTEQHPLHGRPDGAGNWVRIERQQRWSGRDRPLLLEVFTPCKFASLWREPLHAALTSGHTRTEAVEAVVSACAEGSIDSSAAQRLIGWLVLVGGAGVSPAISTRKRYLALLQGVGVERITESDLSATSRELLLRCADSWTHLAPADNHDLMQKTDALDFML